MTPLLLLGFICICEASLSHVRSYDVVRPLRLLGRDRRSLESSQEHPEKLQYALDIKGRNFIIQLEKNRFLLAKYYTETHYSDNGTEVTVSPSREDHCYYHGYIQDMKDSAVSVGLCSGMRGFVRAKKKLYLIEPLEDSVDGDHAIYEEKHLRRRRASCGHDNDTYYDHETKVSGLFKPKSWKSKPLSDKQWFIEMFLVVDNAEYITFKRNMETVKARMLEIANHVDKLYRSMNIRVVLVGLEVWSNRDKIDISRDPDQTLTRFLEWRKSSLLPKTSHDNAQLVTGIDFMGDTVGLANKYAMCTQNSGAVNQDHNLNPIGVASTIAHEMGHNLGMSHDNAQCTCGTSASTSNCIMSEKVGTVFPENFSRCSQTELSKFLGSFNPSCLLDTPGPDRRFGGPVCGNAFLDPGEECDCGTMEDCSNPCCNATTCRLTEGSQCAEGACCESCQLKQAGSVCRKAASDCDLEEFCMGNSAQCPKDVFKMNGLPCSYGQGYCYNGSCPTHLQACRTLWGSDAQVAGDSCFYQNTFGTKDSYCKKSQYQTYPCADKDVTCGTIYCAGGNAFPTTGKKAVIRLRHTECAVAVLQSQTEESALVPTGTKCGYDKVCHENSCQDVKVYGTQGCAAKCSNHGVCDHENQCHCDPGWAPPYCDVKHSGFTQERSAVVIAVSVTMVILILLTLVVGGLMCCRRNADHKYTSKMKVVSTSGLSNPLFMEGGAKGGARSKALQISSPTFVETTATHVCSPLEVNVSANQIPNKIPKKSPNIPATIVKPSCPPPSSPSNVTPTQFKTPPPPTKPLPPLHVKHHAGSSAGNVSKAKPPLPAASKPRQSPALKPPVRPR